MTAPASDAAIEKDMVGGTVAIFLDLDGQFAGWANGVSGGHTKAVLVDTFDERSTVIQKRIAGLAVEDLEVTFGIEMAPAWWQWISQSIGANPGIAHNITVFRGYMDGRPIDQLVLRQARIRQVQFPIFDGASRDKPSFKVILTAESSSFEDSGAQPKAPPRPLKPSALSNTFRFELGQLPTHGLVLS